MQPAQTRPATHGMDASFGTTRAQQRAIRIGCAARNSALSELLSHHQRTQGNIKEQTAQGIPGFDELRMAVMPGVPQQSMRGNTGGQPPWRSPIAEYGDTAEHEQSDRFC